MTANPYEAPSPTDATSFASIGRWGASGWVRNLTSLVACIAIYTILAMSFAIGRTAIPETALFALLAFAAITAGWANLPLGPKIGWDRGGLPVVFVAFFAALTIYCSTAMVVGGYFCSLVKP